MSVIIPGDIGEEEQFVLAQSVRPVDVLIAPHHGSGDLSAEFYRAAGARLGAVSVGENRYGHPTTESLRAFGPIPVRAPTGAGRSPSTQAADTAPQRTRPLSRVGGGR